MKFNSAEEVFEYFDATPPPKLTVLEDEVKAADEAVARIIEAAGGEK